MILSVSRRTDIPAFYSDWFFNRIREGYVLARNPLNPKQVSKIVLNPGVIDCIVFWTKNPIPMMERLNELKDYKYYFQFTLNSYGKDIEQYVPEKKNLINVFIKLSNTLGKDRIVWRYDPILLTDKYDKGYHYKWFEYLCKCLCSYTNRCIISFMDMYKKTERNLKSVNIFSVNESDMEEIAEKFSDISKKYNISIQSCSEKINLDKFNIAHGKCIDDKLISKILGQNVFIDKDTNQRENCGCVKSIDIGAYNTCRHGCIYCYANFNNIATEKNYLNHDPESPLLFGKIREDDVIYDRKMESYVKNQITLFD